MQFCVTRVILRDLAALVPQIFHSLHKITHFLTGYINSYSINVQAVCDSNLIIKNVVCRWPGWSHDYTIFRNSRLRAYLENRIYGEGSVVVGDSGYRLKSYNITPLANPRTAAENLFNESSIRTRNPIERCFG
jgi:hypothetical protein